jgi:hypothetical protein
LKENKWMFLMTSIYKEGNFFGKFVCLNVRDLPNHDTSCHTLGIVGKASLGKGTPS